MRIRKNANKIRGKGIAGLKTRKAETNTIPKGRPGTKTEKRDISQQPQGTRGAVWCGAVRMEKGYKTEKARQKARSKKATGEGKERGTKQKHSTKTSDKAALFTPSTYALLPDLERMTGKRPFSLVSFLTPAPWTRVSDYIGAINWIYSNYNGPAHLIGFSPSRFSEAPRSLLSPMRSFLPGIADKAYIRIISTI